MIQNKPKYAFILAAGKGSRLRPYTDTMPKPMVPVHGQPILDHTLEKLVQAGVENVTINLNYLGDRIKNYYEGRSHPKITFSEETELLDTGGGVKYALETMQGQPFYLINGDAFWTDLLDRDSALDALATAWDPQKMDILLLLQPLERMVLTHGVGDYDLNEDGTAVRALNKTGAYMFGGIRIVSPHIFEGIEEDIFSFLKLMDKAQEQGRLYGVVHHGEWHHISTPEELERVNTAFHEKQDVKSA